MSNSQALVIVENNVPLADSRIIAEQLGVKHINVIELIRDHQERIEKHFGFVRFETEKIEGRGRPEQFCLLTENQAHYILTLSRNTDKSMEVKALFVKAFDEAKQQLLNYQIALTEQLAQLHERLNNLPPGLSPFQIDRAESAANSLYSLFGQNLSHIGTFYSERKINDEQWNRLIKTLEGMMVPMATLRVVVQNELEYEEALTEILFDYRDALKTIAPGYQLQSYPTIEEHRKEALKMIEEAK